MTLTLDQVIRHTVVYLSSTSTYIPNFVQIIKSEKLFVHRRTYERTFRLALLSRNVMQIQKPRTTVVTAVTITLLRQM